jgi:hypothetical protein
MQKNNKLEVVKDDSQDVADWIRDVAAAVSDGKLCERIYEERCHFRMNSQMKAQVDYIRKCKGGIDFADYMRDLILKDIARFYIKKGEYKDADRR